MVEMSERSAYNRVYFAVETGRKATRWRMILIFQEEEKL